MIAANDEPYPVVTDLLACDATQLRQLIGHAGGLLAHKSGPSEARKVLMGVATALWDRPSIKALAEEFCALEGMSLDELTGVTRCRACAWPRQHFMHICVVRHGKSVSAVSRFLNRDHTTVIFGVRAHERRAGL